MIVNVDAKSWHGNSIRSRFEEKVVVSKTSDCFLWIASKRGRNGYGGFRVDKNTVKLAHNVAYEIYRGSIPDGMKVLHTCDNPLCVNPTHLFLGTQQENIKDRDLKGRQRNKSSVKKLGYTGAKKEGSFQ
jgi:hypothetical protein